MSDKPAPIISGGQGRSAASVESDAAFTLACILSAILFWLIFRL